MPRTRRYIRANRPYELDIRVKSGLPFACLLLIKLVLKSALARAQRDNKVLFSVGPPPTEQISSIDLQAAVQHFVELSRFLGALRFCIIIIGH